ncbi:MAG: hypothetical protein GY750_20120 [Lentisphaerae bacterium]|nr:hypothetical protein [Lentisphaerota bacterium]MCP4103701.1 hypothetical protein [Lentisphaerota bacterium]
MDKMKRFVTLAQITVLLSIAGAAENTNQSYLGEDAQRNKSYFELQNVIDKHFDDEEKAKKAEAKSPKTKAKKTEKTKKPQEAPLADTTLTTKAQTTPAQPQVELTTQKKPQEVDLTTFRGFRKRRAVDKKVDFYTGIIPRSSNRYLTNFISDPNAPRQPVTIPFEGPIQAYQWKSFQKKWNYSRFQTNLYGKRLYISYKNKYNFPGPFNPGSKLAVEVVKINREKQGQLPAVGLQPKNKMSNKDLSQQKAEIKAFYMRGQKQKEKERQDQGSSPQDIAPSGTIPSGAESTGSGTSSTQGTTGDSGTSSTQGTTGSEDIQG